MKNNVAIFSPPIIGERGLSLIILLMENILNELFNIQNEIDEILETEELRES